MGSQARGVRAAKTSRQSPPGALRRLATAGGDSVPAHTRAND